VIFLIDRIHFLSKSSMLGAGAATADAEPSDHPGAPTARPLFVAKTTGDRDDSTANRTIGKIIPLTENSRGIHKTR
jgi:hypothetical protein